MSDQSRKIYKPKPVSGFPEWLPEVRLVEQQWFDHIRKVFESYGFCSIETPSVEELGVLEAKGEVDKEIYVIERLHKEEGDKEARLALHFDQTVPLARYVAQHFNELVFPFKRYQMQRVWRGERPQAGRFREFYQCDIDVINVDSLPLHFDAELPAIMYEVMKGLPGMEGEKIQIRVSNRKILVGLLRALGVTSQTSSSAQAEDPSIGSREHQTGSPAFAGDDGGEIAQVLRIIDKLEKIGKDQTRQLLIDKNLTQKQVDAIFKVIESKKSFPEDALKYVDSENIVDKNSHGFITMSEGMRELSGVMNQLSHLREGAVVADLGIVRGLDYYTGTVYETVFLDKPEYGSICSGGRYDDLAGGYINKKLPGVGISIGFSRLFAYLQEQGKLPVAAKSPAHILIVLPSDDERAAASEAARALRGRGLNVELYHAAKKIPDQLKYASRKGIPHVWFPFAEGHQVKNMATGAQTPADPATWVPEKDRNP